MPRNKAPLKQLETKTPWKQGAVFQHRGVKVECVLVQDARYWKVKGYLDRSPDQAMDRAEGRPLSQIIHGTRPPTVAPEEDPAF